MRFKRLLLSTALTSFGGLLLCAVTLSAQNAAPAAAGSTAVKPKMGHVRLWNMAFSSPSGLDLVLGSGSAARVLQPASTANFSAAYSALPPGHYTVGVYREGDKQTPVKSFDLNVADKSYYTIFVQHFPGGQLTAELIDDTPDPKAPPANRLTVRQVSFISHGMVVVAGNQQTQPLEPGGVQTITGLTDGIVPVQTRMTTATGLKSCDGEVDFREARHATLFIVSDSHRILRLRFAPTGPSPAEEAEAAREAKSKP